MMAEPTEDAKRLGAAIGDVDFRSGGHMLAWADAMRDTLRVYEFMLAANAADIRAGLSHQKWRFIKGELPPKIRAVKVVVHITFALVAVRVVIKGVETFKLYVTHTYIKPAQSAGEKAA